MSDRKHLTKEILPPFRLMSRVAYLTLPSLCYALYIYTVYAYVTHNVTICHLLIDLNKAVITIDHKIVQVCSLCSVSQNPGDEGISFTVIRTDSVIE